MTFEIEVGRTVANKYELLRLLGRGAMGEVWLARHTTLGEEVAIKFLKNEDGEGEGTPAALQRFLFEAQVAARLSRKSRNIVQVTDHGEEGGLAYLVMQRLEGESLDERIQRGPLPFPMVKRIVAQVARGLAQAHLEGVFHRDLKPANIFLCEDEEGKLLVKVLDFGIARAIQKERTRSPTSTGRGVILGTPSYMSPEQARGLPNLDHRCDLWALAVVAYEALANDIPFWGETAEDIFISVCTHIVIPIGERRPELGPEVIGFFDRALAADIGQRFQTAEAFTEAFEQLEPGEEGDALWLRPKPVPHDGIATHAKLALSMNAIPRPRGRVLGFALLGAIAGIVLAIGVKFGLSTRDGAASAVPSGRTWDGTVPSVVAIPPTQEPVVAPSPSPSPTASIVARPIQTSPSKAFAIPVPTVALPRSPVTVAAPSSVPVPALTVRPEAPSPRTEPPKKQVDKSDVF